MSTSGYDFAFVRIGGSSTSYNEWQFGSSMFTHRTWSTVSLTLDQAEAVVTGDGWATTGVSYVAFGIAATSESAVKANFKFDNISIVSNLQVIV